MYLAFENPDNSIVIIINNSTWADAKTNAIEHQFASKNKITPSLNLSYVTKINETTVTPSVIKPISFLKYVHVVFKDKAEILSFYNNIFTQGIY